MKTQKERSLKFESSAFAFVCFEISTLLKLEISTLLELEISNAKVDDSNLNRNQMIFRFFDFDIFIYIYLHPDLKRIIFEFFLQLPPTREVGNQAA